MGESFIESLARPSEWTSTHLAGLVGLLLVVAPFAIGSYQTYLLTDALILGLFATGFNVLYGYTGLLSFGHAMFFAGAGYTLAVFMTDGVSALGLGAIFGGATPLVALAIAVVVGVLVAVILAVPVGFLSVRLEEIYFAMITLSFSMAVYTIILQDYGGVTNGSDGITVILSEADLFGIGVPLLSRTVYYFLVLAIVAPSMYLLWRIVRSPFGTVLTAIRENPERAAAIGIDVRRQRWASFVISAAFSGLAGAIYIPLHNVVAPGIAHWSFSAEPVIMTVLGGPYSFAGPILGAFVFRYLRWFVTQYPFFQAHWQLVFGTLVLVVLLFFKQGVAGALKYGRRYVEARSMGEPEGEP